MTKLFKVLAVAAVGLSTLVPSLALAYDGQPCGERGDRIEDRWERRGQMYRDDDGVRFGHVVRRVNHGRYGRFERVER
ncbi:MAG TPA: hypothetical protein VH208_13105 [Myxococcaceae bacterium]|jgi:hypothetical protein|nr:hypothetical protein [Myxococcaceae bacterium]